ncbi:hypothetical protein F5I97DRAFT_1899140 [Phlebopus sp. FC_14]|nr:hypothetical protein F5I97DRAFT_1899140 [Phlebopus sp. FC_14]
MVTHTEPPQVPPATPKVIYGEQFVPMPVYTSDDRKNWDLRVRGSGRPISEYIILFEQPPAAPATSSWTSFSGVPMMDCLDLYGSDGSNALSLMRYPEEQVFSFMEGTGRREVIFVLRWPGYTGLNWVRRLPIYKGDKFATRAELAFHICNEFRLFVEACEMGKLCTINPTWKVGGPDGIPFSRMKISSIWSPEDFVWVASVRVVGPVTF